MSSPKYQIHCARLSSVAVGAMITIAIVVLINIAGAMNEAWAEYGSWKFTLPPLAWLLPLYPCFAALNRLSQVFGRCADGHVFTAQNGFEIKMVGLFAIVAILLMSLVAPAIYAWLHPLWDALWVIDVEPGDSTSLFLAFVIWMFGWLIERGVQLQAENESFV